jgi:sulfonate transport system permease protein
MTNAESVVGALPRGRQVVLTAGGVTRPRFNPRVPSVVRRAIVPVLIVLLWQAGSSWRWWPPSVLPSPVTVAEAFWALVRNGQLPSNLWVSLRRVLLGASIGVTVGTCLGIASGLWRIVEEAFDSTLQMMRTLPYLVMLPLFVIWFGVDEFPKILIIVIGSSLPMYLNTFAGVRSVDPRLIEMATTFGLRRARLIATVIIPAAMPAILTGLRYSLGISWLSLVVAEQINARSGLGFLISNAESLFVTKVLVVCILVYAVLGLTTDVLVRGLERRLLAWRGKGVRW